MDRKVESKLQARLKEFFDNMGKGSPHTLLEKYPNLSKKHLEAAYEIGRDLFVKKQYEKAENVFYILALMDHFEQRYWKALAVTLFFQKRYQDSLSIYLAAHLLDIQDVEVLSAMADCCIKLGDAKGAEEFLSQVCVIVQEDGVRPDLGQRAETLLTMLRNNLK